MNNLTNDLNDLNLESSGGANNQTMGTSTMDGLIKQDSVQSTQQEDIIDDEKLAEYDKNDTDYLTKESLIELLKTYKSLLVNNKESGGGTGGGCNNKKKQESLCKKLKSSLPLSESFYDFNNKQNEKIDLMDTETSYESSGNFCLNYGGDNHHEDEDEDVNSQPNQQELENNKKIFQELKSILFKSNHFNFNKSQDVDDDHDEEDDDYDDQTTIIDDDLPKNLIVTQLPSELFSSADIKTQFEKIFLNVDPNCKFCYFRIFKRCLIQYDDSISAILARFELDDYLFMNDRLRIFLTKPIKLRNTRPFLEPPKNDKTFLISPPSSPPVGWEQIHEDPPVINYDLLAALSKLNPHEPCELIKSNNEIPGIVIHPCPDLNDAPEVGGQAKRKYIPTRRPANDF